jgi:hypothetical protein
MRPSEFESIGDDVAPTASGYNTRAFSCGNTFATLLKR